MSSRSSKAWIRRRRRWVAAPAFAAALSLASLGAAGGSKPDEPTLEAARALGRAGLDLYDKGDCQGALAKLEPAYALYKAPTLGIAAARCHQKHGKLAAAEARYREVMEAELGPKPSALFVQAKQDAAREHAIILPRVPRLTIVVEPEVAADGRAAEITLDGAALSADDIGEVKRVEVGAHEVHGRRGEAEVKELFELNEGEDRRVVLKLFPPKKPASPPPSPPPGRVQRAVGWGAIGVGAAGLVAGGVMGGLALSQRDELSAGPCRGTVCPARIQPQVDEYNTLRRASGVAFIAGGAIAAAGVILLVTAPSTSAKKASSGASPRFEAGLGLASIQMNGTF